MLLEFVEKLKTTKETGQKSEAMWADFSSRWFSLMHTTRPMRLHDVHELADHVSKSRSSICCYASYFSTLKFYCNGSMWQAASAFETVRDINTASRLIGDMRGDTLGDPLSDRYKKLGCKISVVDKESEDYKMVVKYLETTYEPVKVSDVVRLRLPAWTFANVSDKLITMVYWLFQEYGVSVENVFAVESEAIPSLDDIKKLPNKVLLWCGKEPKSRNPVLSLFEFGLYVFFHRVSELKSTETHLQRVLACSLLSSGPWLYGNKECFSFVFCNVVDVYRS